MERRLEELTGQRYLLERNRQRMAAGQPLQPGGDHGQHPLRRFVSLQRQLLVLTCN